MENKRKEKGEKRESKRTEKFDGVEEKLLKIEKREKVGDKIPIKYRRSG